MSCTLVCKGLKWEIQEVCFEAVVFIVATQFLTHILINLQKKPKIVKKQ